MKEDCVIKEDEHETSNQIEIVMNGADVTQIPNNQTATQETQWTGIDLQSKVFWTTSSQNLCMGNFSYE